MAARWKKLFKQYERHVLIGVVIILLATFSISGIFTRGARLGGTPRDDGGEFDAAPGVRVKVTSEEYDEVLQRYEPIYMIPQWGPSIRWAPEMLTPRSLKLRTNQAVWQHIVLVRAAKEAGYQVGDQELREGIETLVRRAMSGGGRDAYLPFTPELYDQVLGNWYRGHAKVDFEKTVREILLKDEFLLPIVESMRFSTSRADAYEAWKGTRERVDLSYVGVPAAQFLDAVGKEEDTRSTIATISDALGKVGSARRVVGLVSIAAETFRAKKGHVAEDAKELATDPEASVQLGVTAGALPADPWGKPVAYRKKGDGFEVFSAGPDGKDDTADDVGQDVAKHLDTLGSLRLVGDALVDWRAKAGTWPATLSDLTKPPPSPDGGRAPAPLASVPKDAWDHELAYDAADAKLLSTGPDGVRGNDDDVEALVAPGGAKVPLPKRLRVFVDPGKPDAWGRPLAVGLKKASPPTFAVESPGADGAPGTEDDVATGNSSDLQVFYSTVRRDYREPMKREFEALYVLLPLVPDASLAKAWKDHPEWHHDETGLFDRWRHTTEYFVTRTGEGADAKVVDPADPALGHGVALLQALEKAGKVPAGTKGWLVPAPETFGEQKDPPADLAKRSASDPLWQEYVSRGWRRVLLREMFFEDMLAETLRKARESAAKHQEWEKGGKAGPEPEVETFEKRLASLAAYAPSAEDAARGGRFVDRFVTTEPLSREGVEAVVEVSDFQVTEELKRLKDGDYAPIPTVAKGAAEHLAVHVTKVHEERDPPLEEVRAKVWPKYLDARALDRAAKELERVRDAAVKGGTIADAAKSVADPRHVEWFQGSTGTFLAVPNGFLPPLPVPEGATAPEKAAVAQRSFVRQNGAEVVSNHGSKQDTQPTGEGAVGARILKDGAHGTEPTTNAAYVVQVKSRRDPPPEELTTKRYADWLRSAVYDGPPWDQHAERLQQRRGVIPRELARWFDDWDGFKHTFELHTNRPIEVER